MRAQTISMCSSRRRALVVASAQRVRFVDKRCEEGARSSDAQTTADVAAGGVAEEEGCTERGSGEASPCDKSGRPINAAATAGFSRSILSIPALSSASLLSSPALPTTQIAAATGAVDESSSGVEAAVPSSASGLSAPLHRLARAPPQAGPPRASVGDRRPPRADTAAAEARSSSRMLRRSSARTFRI
jgi:hypothetical protein